MGRCVNIWPFHCIAHSITYWITRSIQSSFSIRFFLIRLNNSGVECSIIKEYEFVKLENILESIIGGIFSFEASFTCWGLIYILKNILLKTKNQTTFSKCLAISSNKKKGMYYNCSIHYRSDLFTLSDFRLLSWSKSWVQTWIGLITNPVGILFRNSWIHR